MEDATLTEWTKELNVLLQLVQSKPSADLERERERIIVLNRLIADRADVPAA